LREPLKERGIELIVRTERTSKLQRYEEGRKLRRYKRRWIVERTHAWLRQFRRLLVRHEHPLLTYWALRIMTPAVASVVGAIRIVVTSASL